MDNNIEKIRDQREELLSIIKKSTDSVRIMVLSFLALSLFLKVFLKIPFSSLLFLLELLWLLLSFPFFYITKRMKGVIEINNFHLFWIVCELFLLTLIIHFIGSILWVGPFFYLFFAIYENFLFGKKQRVIMLFLTIVFYVSLISLEFFRFIPSYNLFFSFNPYENLKYVISTVIITSGMIVFSFLASDIFRTELENKVRQIFKVNKSLLDAQGSLEEANKELSKRMEILEKMNKLTVGRELRIVELKKKIKELEKEIEKKVNY